METPEYAAMMRRLIRRYGVRVGNGDPVDLAEMVAIRDTFDEAIRVAVRGQHDADFSWREIAEGLGTTREAAWQRYRRQGVAKDPVDQLSYSA